MSGGGSGINTRTLGYGLGFGLMDAIALPIVKGVSRNSLDPAWMMIPALLYAGSPFLFLSALREETLTIMNLVWDLTSDVVVSLIGLFVFHETISPIKMIGIGVSFVGLILMSWESPVVNEYLSHNYSSARSSMQELFGAPHLSQKGGGGGRAPVIVPPAI